MKHIAPAENALPPTATPATDTAWRVVVAGYFGVMVSFGSLLVFTFSIFLKPLTASFGWSRESVSAAFGFAALTVAVCSPLLGILLDRFGPRPVILPCMTVFGLAFASLGLLTSNLAHLYAIFILLGMVGNGTTQMGYSRAVSTWFDRKRGLALALVMAGVGTGAMLFPPLAQGLIDRYGWRQAYFVFGALVLLFGLPLTARYVRERPRASGVPHADERHGLLLRQALRTPAFWIVAGTLFFGSVSVNGAITHLSPLLTDRGVTPGTAALCASVLGLASFCGRLLTGLLLDRFFGPRVGFCLLVLTAAGILLLAHASSGAAGITAAALIGVGLGGEADITPYLLTRYFGLRSFSTLYGLTWTAYAIAGALGPVVMGHAFDATGSYAALLLALSVATAVSAVLFLALPRYPEFEVDA
ncbi:MAG: MFS transporter [Bryobacterales bacterium]|nr:MFS transporter [Bryobacterales bacterium]